MSIIVRRYLDGYRLYCGVGVEECVLLQCRFIKTWRGYGWMERPHPLQLRLLSLRLVSNQLLHRVHSDQYQVSRNTFQQFANYHLVRFTIAVAWQPQDTPAVLTPPTVPYPTIQREPSQVEYPPPPQHTHSLTKLSQF